MFNDYFFGFSYRSKEMKLMKIQFLNQSADKIYVNINMFNVVNGEIMTKSIFQKQGAVKFQTTFEISDNKCQIIGCCIYHTHKTEARNTNINSIFFPM